MNSKVGLLRLLAARILVVSVDGVHYHLVKGGSEISSRSQTSPTRVSQDIRNDAGTRTSGNQTREHHYSTQDHALSVDINRA